MKLDLSNVTLWSCVFTKDENILNRTLKVMRYCLRNASFNDAVLFSAIEFWDPLVNDVRIPVLDLTRFNAYVNTSFPLHMRGDFAMSVHEDGFPIRWDLWSPEFLGYDYIGAPWPDGVVGNGGFSIESRKMLAEKRKLPHPSVNTEWIENDVVVSRSIPADVYLCRTHRAALESAGCRWAPVDVAARFSTEQTHKEQASFGFHGRIAAKEKYDAGWRLVEA